MKSSSLPNQAYLGISCAVFLFLCIFVLTFQYAAAQEVPGDGSERSVKAREMFKNHVRNLDREERESALPAAAQKRVQNLLSNIVNRTDATVRRFEQIIQRIESRTNKVAAAGGEVRPVIEALSEARNSITDARMLVAEGTTLESSVSGSPTPRETWEHTKAFVVEVNEGLRNAKDALKRSVTALKEAAATVPATEDEQLEIQTSEETETPEPVPAE